MYSVFAVRSGLVRVLEQFLVLSRRLHHTVGIHAPGFSECACRLPRTRVGKRAIANLRKQVFVRDSSCVENVFPDTFQAGTN